MNAQENGFEYQNRFYPWHAGDTGKDLMLIDRLTGLSISEFFEALEEQPDRGTILLAIVATSLRHGNPTWSVDHVYRVVTELSLSEDLEFVNPDQQEDGPNPPSETPATEEQSNSQSNGSSPSSTLPAFTPSPTSFVAPT